MLRSLVLILLIVNATFYAWSHGWLNKVVGVQPDAQHEPQRLAQQVNADKIKVATPPADDKTEGQAAHADGKPAPDVASGASTASAASAADAASAPTPAETATSADATTLANKDTGSICVEAGPFNPTESAAVDAMLKPMLPAGSWSSHAVAIQGLWLVYMGPYTDGDMLERKQAELRRIKGLNFEEVRTPASLAQGISLGRYNRQEDAEAGLNVLRSRGIRTARVVNIRPNMDVQVVRVAHATVKMQVSLAGLKMPQGKGFTACRS
ncbi:MAG: hypothetical protein QM749_19175 [Aquabacterium sp.]